MIVFPAIDILDGKAVRLAKGSYSDVTEYNENPVEQAKAFCDAGARWIHVVDLDGAREGRSVNHKVVEKILSCVDIDIEIGGGIRDMEAIKRHISSGAKRVVLGTRLATDPEFAMQAAAEYEDYIVAGIDARDGYVSISGWTEDEKLEAEKLVSSLGNLGIGHLVYTDISRDGMLTGVDIERYVQISKIAGFPVAVSGGVSRIDDVRAASSQPQYIEGIIIGRAIYEKTIRLEDALAVCGS